MNTRRNCMKPRGWAFFATICAAALALPLFADPVQIDPADYECSFNVKFVGYKGTSTLTDFPVLIRLSKALNDFNYAKCTDGASLRFADSAGNLIPHEIDTWNENGTSLVWVKVPSLTKETVIKVCYGYKGSGTPPSVTASDVWSNGYVGVWHLNESTLPMKESSGVSTDFSNAGGSGIVYGADGAIGRAVDFSAGDSNSRLSAEDDSDLDCFTDMTIELWSWQAGPSVNSTNGVKNAYILAKRTKNNEDAALALYNNSAPTDPAKHGRNVLMVSTNGTSWSYVIMTSNNMEPTWGAWCHQAFVRDAAGNKGYWSLSGSRSNGNGTGSEPLFNTASKLHLGNSQGGGVNFNGLIDELRISRVARSQAWLKASHDTVAMRNFATCGEATEIVNGFVTIIR